PTGRSRNTSSPCPISMHRIGVSRCATTRTMRRQFLDDPVLCDLVLIRGHYGMRALHGALHEIERPVAALVEAGLTPEQAVETYGAISVHSRGSVVLQRLQQKTEGFPAQRSNGNRYIGFADDIDFDYILDSILDRAQHLISLSTASRNRLCVGSVTRDEKRWERSEEFDPSPLN